MYLGSKPISDILSLYAEREMTANNTVNREELTVVKHPINCIKFYCRIICTVC